MHLFYINQLANIHCSTTDVLVLKVRFCTRNVKLVTLSSVGVSVIYGYEFLIASWCNSIQSIGWPFDGRQLLIHKVNDQPNDTTAGFGCVDVGGVFGERLDNQRLEFERGLVL